MTLRVFLRGGYQELQGPTMVVKHGIPVFTVMPHGMAPAADQGYLDKLTQVSGNEQDGVVHSERHQAPDRRESA